MVRKYSPQSTMTRDREPPRNYVDFEDRGESEAAVQRWLTSPASNSNTRFSNNIPARRSFSKSWARHTGSDAGGSTPSTLEQRMTMSSPGGTRTPGKGILKERLRERVLKGRSSSGHRLLPLEKEPERMRRSFFHEGGEEHDEPSFETKKQQLPKASTPISVPSFRENEEEHDQPSFETTKKQRAKASSPRSVPPTVDDFFPAPSVTFPAPPSVTNVKDNLSLRMMHPSDDNSAPPPIKSETSPIKRKKTRLQLKLVNNAASRASIPELIGDMHASPVSSVNSIQNTVAKTISPLSAGHVASPPSPPRPRPIYHTSPAPPSERTRDLVSLESSRHRSNATSPTAIPETASGIQHSEGQVDQPRNKVGSPSIADRPHTHIQENYDGLGSKNSLSKDEQSETAASRRSGTSIPQSPESRDVMGRNLNRPSTFDRRHSYAGPMRTNRVKLHIYDLIAAEVIMPLPWGCNFPIGSCFNALNNTLHEMGSGAYHVGIETHGVEYAYGANDKEMTTGVFTCMPKNSPGYQYRTTIDFGERPLMRKAYIRINGNEIRYKSKLFDTPPKDGEYQEIERHVDGREVLREMGREYLGTDYDLLRKNCCTFGYDACTRLGVQESDIPSWFSNLAYAGAVTQDVAMATTRPLTTVLSACDCENGVQEYVAESGFEVFTDYQGKEQTQVVDFDTASHDSGSCPGSLINERSFTV